MGNLQEPGSKIETTRCFSPDILHVFNDDQDANMRTMLVEDLTDQHSAPSSFPQFSRLPIELRYLIWEAALPEPTIVPRTWNSPFGYNLHRKVPEVLQACSESRRLLIASAETAQGAPTPKYQLVQRRDRRDEGVYLNWRTDSIWIYRGYDIKDSEVASYTNLQNLVMTWGLPKIADIVGGFLRAWLARAIDLEVLEEIEAHRGKAYLGSGPKGVSRGECTQSNLVTAESAHRASDSKLVS
ncbi:hypothetical protein N0V82_003332 [Gnomoniopsis sp. IMI 355080]|nr:hypothetical protein N0V82_003332 [Gnomoniopsis sp. IMI 355080]